ncbi:MAG TPA: class I SAM-dependent methyltransferase [Gemmatimonadaceae bacterium]|nr:class I SAM-dependent methyltransferase [Gemmatimonadaceae bacterium]
MKNSTWQSRYYARFYHAKPGYVEGTTEFHALIKENCHRGWRILEIGSGPTNRTSRFLATLGEVHGIDPDPDVMANDALKSASIMSEERFPVASESFDCCVSNYVVEHVPDGMAHLEEVARVLKPGGVYVFRTVNGFHYLALVAKLTPHWFHRLVANRARGLAETAHDPYPTVYAMNSSRAITRAARAARLEVERIVWSEKEPPYAHFSRIAFLAMMLYERVVNSTGLFAGLRSNMFVVLRKSA